MITTWLLAALTVTVEPAFLPCRPPIGAGATVVEAKNDAGAEDRRVAVELTDYLARVAVIELDLPARSHKRLLVMPPLVGHVRATLVEEDGTRTALPYPARPECSGPSFAALARDDGRTGVTFPPDLGGSPFEHGILTRQDLAGTWRPLLALDAVVAEARALHELSDAELGLLLGWVRGGGVLVVVPGLDPAPLFASGRLPKGLLANAPWDSARLGAGVVVVMADPASGDPRLAGVLTVSVDARRRWNDALGRVFEAQRDRAGPAGRTSRPAGVLSLGICLLTAAAAHELLRRKFVLGTRDFARYFQGLGIVLGASALSGFLAAFVGTSANPTSDLVVAHSSGSGSASRAFLVGGHRSRELAPGSWPFAERDVRYVLGARTAVKNDSSGARVALERTPFDLGGALVMDPLANELRNDTPHAFDAGWRVVSTGCQAVPPLAPGATVALGVPGECPLRPEVLLVTTSAKRSGLEWLVARSGDRLFVVSLEQP